MDGEMLSSDYSLIFSSLCESCAVTQPGWGEVEGRYGACFLSQTVEGFKVCLWMLRYRNKNENSSRPEFLCGRMVGSQAWLPGLLMVGEQCFSGAVCTHPLVVLWFSRDYGYLLSKTSPSIKDRGAHLMPPTTEEETQPLVGFLGTLKGTYSKLEAWKWPVMNTKAFRLGRNQHPCLLDFMYCRTSWVRWSVMGKKWGLW